MRVEIITFTRPFWSLNWQLDPDDMAIRLSDWLRENEAIEIHKINHDVVTSFWYPPQIIVAIYYRKLGESS